MPTPPPVPPTAPPVALNAADLEQLSREQLIALVVDLSQQFVGLTAQLTALSDKVASAPATSRTSSKPPSSDGYAKPAPKPTSRRTRTGRKPGGQPGAPGTTLRQVTDPDLVIEHRPALCGGCSHSLAGRKPTRLARRQVADLPQPRLVWTEHRIATITCACGHRTRAGAGDGVPAEAVGPVQYGPGVKAAATYLLNAHFLPLARTATAMGDLLGAPVSPGSITTWQQRAAADLAVPGGFLETVRDALRQVSVLHADETGLRTQGSLAWVHVACTVALSLFTVHVGDGRRGKTAIEASGVIDHLPEDSVLVTDAWGPYLTYAMLHALCAAHVVRELRAVAESGAARTTDPGSQSWAHKMLRLLETLNTDVHTARQEGASELDGDLLAQRMRTFTSIMALAEQQNPAPPGGWPSAAKRPKAVNLLLRLATHREAYLRFTLDFDVPFTNNQAERDLRGVRLRENVSGCLRTLDGARAFVAIRSYLTTAAKQGRHALTVLRDLHAGRAWIPATTLG